MTATLRRGTKCLARKENIIRRLRPRTDQDLHTPHYRAMDELPFEIIIRLIYSYDPTYKDIFDTHTHTLHINITLASACAHHTQAHLPRTHVLVVVLILTLLLLLLLLLLLVVLLLLLLLVLVRMCARQHTCYNYSCLTGPDSPWLIFTTVRKGG